MTTSLRIASAALLALAPGPREEEADVAILDLSGDRSEVAKSMIQTTLAAVGPRLFLQGDLRLFITAGELGVERAAALVSDQLDETARSTTQIGVIRGEDLTSRIEELTRSGHELRDAGTDRRLIDELAPPERTWSPAPAAPLSKALGNGARIVVSQWADPGTIGIAASVDSLGWDVANLKQASLASIAARLACHYRSGVLLYAEGEISPLEIDAVQQDSAELPDVIYEAGEPLVGDLISFPNLKANTPDSQAIVYSDLPDGAVLSAELKMNNNATKVDSFIEALRGLAQGMRIECTHYEIGTSQKLAIRAHTRPSDALRWMARQFELVCNQYGVRLETPLADSIQEEFRTVRSQAPRDLLEYGCEIRSAEGWLN